MQFSDVNVSDSSFSNDTSAPSKKSLDTIARNKDVPKKVEAFIDEMMRGVEEVTFEEPPRDVPQFRVSSFPYCGVLDYKAMLDHEGRVEDYKFGYYVDCGTAVHEVVQKYLSFVPELGKTARGSWKCMKCKTMHSGEKGFPIKRPKTCSKCSNEYLMYEEAEFLYKHKGVTLSGHLDYLTYKKGIGWVAWEFKTTDDKYIQKEWYRKFLPFAKHPHQIRSYGALLYLCFGIKIAYYNVIYVSRSNPHIKEKRAEPLHRVYTFPYSKDDRTSMITRIKTACESRAKSLALYKGDVKKKPGKKAVWEARPCKSLKDWDNVMTDAFFGKSVCDNLTSCTGRLGKPLPYLRSKKKKKKD